MEDMPVPDEKSNEDRKSSAEKGGSSGSAERGREKQRSSRGRSSASRSPQRKSSTERGSSRKDRASSRKDRSLSRSSSRSPSRHRHHRSRRSSSRDRGRRSDDRSRRRSRSRSHRRRSSRDSRRSSRHSSNDRKRRSTSSPRRRRDRSSSSSRSPSPVRHKSPAQRVRTSTSGSNKFWDGFQWVERTPVIATPANPVMVENPQTLPKEGDGQDSSLMSNSLSQKDRRIYVGNIPQGTTPEMLKEFINSALLSCGFILPDGVASAVLSVWISADLRYSFLELASSEAANVALALNGVEFYGMRLKISRPRTYASTGAI